MQRPRDASAGAAFCPLLPVHSSLDDGYDYDVRLVRRTLLMLALVLSFSMRAPIPCPVAQAHCPMHSTTAPCCRIAGCFSSAGARHEAASLEAPSSVPMPSLAIAYQSRDCHADAFIRAIAPGTSPPPQAAHSIEFRPLLI
jgi:hypothetical protein